MSVQPLQRMGRVPMTIRGVTAVRLIAENSCRRIQKLPQRIQRLWYGKSRCRPLTAGVSEKQRDPVAVQRDDIREVAARFLRVS